MASHLVCIPAVTSCLGSAVATAVLPCLASIANARKSSARATCRLSTPLTPLSGYKPWPPSRSCHGLQVAYITIAGAYIKGAALDEAGATWTQKVAGAGYKQVPPHCRVWGKT